MKWGRQAVSVLAAAAVAGALLLWSTRSGPGLSPDSLKYLLLARNLRAGGGFSYLGEPMTHYPPLYPALLALLGAVGPESLWRASLLQAALFAVNAALLGCLASRFTGTGVRAALLAVLLLLASPTVFQGFMMVWSESLFLVVTLGLALLLSARLAGGGRASLLGAAGCLALAPLVRYAGLAWVPACLLACLFWTRSPLRRRVTDAAVLGIAALLPFSLWLFRNARLAGSLTDRRMVLHLPGIGSAEQVRDSLTAFWGLGEAPAWSVLALVPIAAFVIGGRRVAEMFRRTESEQTSAAALWFALVACGSYAAFLFASISAFDADSPLDTRMLLPIHIFTVALVAALPSRPTLLLVVALGACGFVRTGIEANRLSNVGEGFSRREWRSSAVIKGLQTLPAGTPIATSGPELVAFFRGGDVRDLPAETDRHTLRPRPEYQRELRTLCAATLAGTVVAYLDGITWDWDTPTAEELQAACGLERLARYDDGSVYGFRR